ncbi:phosphoglycerate mutase-like protein [Anaeromyces robustus]|uniref:Phosphoglycerate mutase-like protein n=1 Tax=Anaeromyces robustus TaxID=1754192 RepID=A0A1Y1XHE4_9FUNG|nr:phosphoglycerate mutase-like protein [Anaeromyces robustus]|eukprot:ORX85169.1 phosphoglycerate mutase-like protein [Anaeromyces robustus]
MANSNEEILQVISLFRHGARNTFVNLDNNDYYPTDLCEDKIINTINKGKHFVNKYFNVFSPSPFNNNDFKCYISDTTRTIKTIIYRLSDFVPQEDFKNMKQEELKEFTFKNLPNVVYDDNIFKSFGYANRITCNYFKKDPDYELLLKELESEIGKESEKALEHYKNYLNHPNFKKMAFPNFVIISIYDFLFNVKPEVQKTFTKEHLIIKDVMKKLNANKRIMDINVSNKNTLLCILHQLLTHYHEEMKKVKENDKDKKKIVLFSAHDLYLSSLINFLGVDKTNYSYGFDDEINFIIFKKGNGDGGDDDDKEKLYVKIEYNDDLLDIPFSTMENKKECELDTLLNKIEKEYLFCSFQEIMDFCHLKNEKEFFPSK